MPGRRWKKIKPVKDMIAELVWNTGEFQLEVSNQPCSSHRLCMQNTVMYISWVHVFLTRPYTPYVRMMYGHWQQSLTLYAQLLFAPAVNSHIHSWCWWEGGTSAWHKVKAVVDLICGFVQIAQIENPFVTEYFTEIMYAGTNVLTQQQTLKDKRGPLHGQKYRLGSPLKGQVIPYWSNWIHSGLEWHHQRPSWRVTLSAAALCQSQAGSRLLDKSSWQLQNNANGYSVVAPNV